MITLSPAGKKKKMSNETQKMIRHYSQDATLFRPIHEAVLSINEKYPRSSIRFTADTLITLDNLPIQLERQTGIHNLGGWRLSIHRVQRLAR